MSLNRIYTCIISVFCYMLSSAMHFHMYTIYPFMWPLLVLSFTNVCFCAVSQIGNQTKVLMLLFIFIFIWKHFLLFLFSNRSHIHEEQVHQYCVFCNVTRHGNWSKKNVVGFAIIYYNNNTLLSITSVVWLRF